MSGFDDYMVTTVAAAAGDVLFTRGDSWRLTVKLLDAQGVPVPTGGLVGTFELSAWGAGAWGAAGTVTSPQDGEFLVELSVLESTALPADRFAFALRVDQGAARKTVVRGWLLDAVAYAADRSSTCSAGHSESLVPTACPAPVPCGPVVCDGTITTRPCGTAVTAG